jgi:hypothetical protein
MGKHPKCIDQGLSCGFDRTGIKFGDAVEGLRVQAVQSMKTGRYLVLNLFDKAPDFSDKICGSPKYKVHYSESPSILGFLLTSISIVLLILGLIPTRDV